MSNSLAQRQIVTAYQASPMWSLTLPGDWASYAASTSWSPILTAITGALGVAPPGRAGERVVYGQVVSLLRQTAQLAPQASSLSVADRGALRQFCLQLAAQYEPFTLSHA